MIALNTLATVMSANPTADAFMRGYLREPADATTRMVFADWLEETGIPSNTAWAHYIRAKIEASRHPFRSPEWRAGEVEAATHAPDVIARLTISAKTFVGYPKSLLELLPAANICVRLAAFAFSPTILDLVPQSVARENVIIPIATQGRVLFFATADPRNADTVQKLDFILNRDVIAVGADRDEIQAAINTSFGRTEVETVDSVLSDAPLIGLEGDTISTALGGIFRTSFSRGADALVMTLSSTGCMVRYLRRRTSFLTEEHLQGVYSRLLDHLLSLEPSVEHRANGLRCLDGDLPIVGGGPCPVTLERQPVLAVNWFCLRFRW